MVAVFRTSLQTQWDVGRLAQSLSSIHELTRWSVDLEDPDNVLRLEGDRMDIGQIQALVQQAGFDCEELTD